MLPTQRAGSQKGRVSMRRGNLPPTKDTRDSHAKHGDLWRGIVQRQRQFGKVILRRLLSVLLLLASWGWAHEDARLPPAKMVRQPIEGKAPELALVDQSGQPLTLTELRGKVVLLTFTYSTCA